MEKLILQGEKHLKFPFKEFQKYFDNYPSGVIKKLIIDNALACYCSSLAYSLVCKETLPSFKKPKIKIFYYLSDFEINHLKLLNNTNKFILLKTHLKNIEINSSIIKGCLDFKISPMIKENIINSMVVIEIDLNLKSLAIPSLSRDIPTFFKVLYQSFSVALLYLKNHNNFSVKPQVTINKNRSKIYCPLLNLSDNSFDMDVLVSVFHLWMQSSSKDFMLFCVDDILHLRGIKKLLSQGYRSGYKNSTREKVKQEILKLNNKISFEDFIWAQDEDKKRASNLSWAGDVSLFEINSWCVESKYYFMAKPTEFMKCLIERKSYCLISPMLFKYHSYKYALEKKTAYFLIQKFRKKDCLELKVKDFISLLYNKEYFEKPSSIRDRLENILDRLTDSQIIKSWQYKRIDEKVFNEKNWIYKWLRMKILIFKA